jgi:hypothetical protein
VCGSIACAASVAAAVNADEEEEEEEGEGERTEGAEAGAAVEVDGVCGLPTDIGEPRTLAASQQLGVCFLTGGGGGGGGTYSVAL